MADTYPPPSAGPPGAPDGGQDRDQRWVIILLVLALLVVVAAFAAYVLTDDDGDEQDTATSATSQVEASSGGGSSATSDSTPEAPSSAPCTADAFLAAVGGEIDGIAVEVTGSTCTETSGGYAIATMAPADPTVIADPLTVFFEDTGGSWAVLTFGTGVSCAEAGIPAEACADLGG